MQVVSNRKSTDGICACWKEKKIQTAFDKNVPAHRMYMTHEKNTFESSSYPVIRTRSSGYIYLTT